VQVIDVLRFGGKHQSSWQLRDEASVQLLRKARRSEEPACEVSTRRLVRPGSEGEGAEKAQRLELGW